MDFLGLPRCTNRGPFEHRELVAGDDHHPIDRALFRDLREETANPHRNIPLAVIGAVLLAAAIYIMLQVAFIWALSPADLAHGWASLSFQGEKGPFAGLATSLGLGWMATLLYIDAYISRGDIGVMYVTGGSRVLFAAGEMDAGSRWPTKLTNLNGNKVRWVGGLVMWIVGTDSVLPFPARFHRVPRILPANALSPRCTPILTADADKPVNLAVSVTDSPSSFTCMIGRR